MKRRNLFLTIASLSILLLIGTTLTDGSIRSCNAGLTGYLSGTEEVFASQGPDDPVPFNETEPNDSRSQANAIPAGARYVSGSISSARDSDYFSFSANQGDRLFVSVDTSPSMTGRDSMIRILFGNRVIASDDDNGPNPKGSGLAAVPLSNSGTYFVEVRGGSDSPTISSYHLFLCVLIGPTRTENEPDDSIETVTIASNVNGGVIRIPGDTDMWYFPAKEKDTLFVGLNQTGESIGFDAVLELRDPEGSLLLVQDNNKSEPGNGEFLSVLTMPVAGMYSILVREARLSEGDDRYDYLLGICINGYPLRRRPTADAGPDKGVLERDLVTLEGSNSLDPNGEKLSYEWVQLTGPSVAIDRNIADTAFVAPDVGILELIEMVFELRVSNPFGLTDQDRVTVLVSDRFQLRDDDEPSRVLFNLATMRYFWRTATAQSFSGLMTMKQEDKALIFENVSGADPFIAKIELVERSGGAELMSGGVTYTIIDSNIDDSQAP